MAVEYTQAVLEQMYVAGTPEAPVLGPTRDFYQSFSTNAHMGWWENIRDRRIPTEIAKNARILVVGCGFGFLIEKLLAVGFTSVWGIDSAPYYFDPSRAHNFDSGVAARVRQYDITAFSQANRRTLTGSNTLFDAVMTEAVIESYSPSEQDAIYVACEAQRVNVSRPIIHLVYDGWDGTPFGGCPPRTMQEWQTSRLGHTFVSLMGIPGS